MGCGGGITERKDGETAVKVATGTSRQTSVQAEEQDSAVLVLVTWAKIVA